MLSVRHGAHQPEPGVCCLRRQIQPTQRIAADIGLPQQHGAAAAVFKRLLGCLQRIGAGGGFNPQQAVGL